MQHPLNLSGRLYLSRIVKFYSILSSLLNTLIFAPYLFSRPTEMHLVSSSYSPRNTTPRYSILLSINASPLFLNPIKSYL